MVKNKRIKNYKPNSITAFVKAEEKHFLRLKESEFKKPDVNPVVEILKHKTYLNQNPILKICPSTMYQEQCPPEGFMG